MPIGDIMKNITLYIEELKDVLKRYLDEEYNEDFLVDLEEKYSVNDDGEEWTFNDLNIYIKDGEKLKKVF